jgi:type I restriction enzyme S subunit
MSEISLPWVKIPLGQVVALQNGFAFKSANYVKTGHFVIRIGNVQDGKITLTSPVYVDASDSKAENFVLKDGDLLMSLTGNVGRVAFINASHLPAVLNQRVARLYPVSENGVDKKQLFYFLQTPSAKEFLLSVAKGAAQLNISGKDVLALNFPLPPLAEQREIARRLDELLAQVDSLKTRLAAIPNILKRFRQSTLAAATSGKLTEQWREEYGQDFEKRSARELEETMHSAWLESKEREFVRKGKRPKTDTWKNKYALPENESVFSGEWFLVELQHVAEVLDPNPSHRMPKYVPDGLPFISSENILDANNINFDKGKKITEEELAKQKQRYEISDGTFAFTRIGTIGKSVMLPKPHTYGVSHAMAVVTPHKSLMNPPFLQLVISCESILRQATHGVQSVGVPDLGIGKMKSFKIPLPRMEEQTEIVRRVEELFAFADLVEQRVNDAQARVNHLTQSILAKAFRGELTSEWRINNPDLITGENSAEALLKRIKAEREKLTPKKKTRKKK